MKVSPCKGCADRNPGCHDHCEAYKEWKAERDKVREYLRENYITIDESKKRKRWREQKRMQRKTML